MADDAQSFVCDGCLSEQDRDDARPVDGCLLFCPTCLALHGPAREEPPEDPRGILQGRAE